MPEQQKNFDLPEEFGLGLDETASQPQEQPLDEQQAEKTRQLSLPYRFSQRHGLLLESDYKPPGGGEVGSKPPPRESYKLYYLNPPGVHALSEIQRSLGFLPALKKVKNQEIFNAMLQSHYSAQNQSAMVDSLSEEILDLNEAVASLDEPDDLLNSQDEAPIIRLLNAIFFESIRSKASDIHIQPREHKLEVRFRLDGVLHTKIEQPVKIAPLIVSRVKVLARLDIAEKRLPQDGRIALKIGGRNIDMRVSTMPSAFGERVVMRLLDKSGKASRLGELGIDDHVLATLREAIGRPHGIVLVTGPTGSGKTTTLYGALNELDRKRLNIMTIEDPIEYYFDGISQTQINVRADMTFARGLRAILRQDPDVVMIGEVRDFETAEIAIQASLTGHLMLSTLHTNTAVGAVTRLVDMGLPTFLLASTLYAVLSQRLVRRLCDHCRIKTTLSTEDRKSMESAMARYERDNGEKPPSHIYEAKKGGCVHCYHTGYQGRIGIYEVLLIDDTLRGQIHTSASESEMTEHARKMQDAESLRDNGFAKVLAGITSIDEVLRVTQQ